MMDNKDKVTSKLTTRSPIVKLLVRSGLIAAVYAVLTIVLAPISYGELQIRVAEALNVLPFFTFAAVPGLFVGCIIANLISPMGLLDLVFGSLATLLSAYLAYRIKDKRLVPLPAVVINAFVIGALLHFVYGLPLVMMILYVGAGQLLACYGIGYPLLLILERYKGRIFR